MKTHKGTINREGFQLKYSVEGSGSTTVLVIGSSIYYSRVFSQNLRNHFRFVFLDHRGFAHYTGKPLSDKDWEFPLSVFLEDIEYVRKKLGLEQVIVLGHSGHAYMALEYSKRYSPSVSHVILIGAGPSQSTKMDSKRDENFTRISSQERMAAHEKNEKQLSDDFDADPDRGFIYLCSRLVAKGWFNYNFDPSALWEGVHVNQPIFTYVWGHLFKHIDITQGLEAFDKPILLVLGRFDFFVAPSDTWDDILRKFKNIKRIVFDRSGHTPQHEQPEAFDQALLNWLRKNTKD